MLGEMFSSTMKVALKRLHRAAVEKNKEARVHLNGSVQTVLITAVHEDFIVVRNESERTLMIPLAHLNCICLPEWFVAENG